MNTVTYDDLHIDFTWKEWALLNPSQKNLYKDVMLETYRNLATIGSLLGLKVLVNQLLKWRNYFGLRIILNGGGQKRAPDLITGGCEPPSGCWELNSGPLEEQSVLLPTEPSLQP
ncbi:zinc finger protein 426-like isoform X5 [Arvicola amphibius]|uniref:zinc finger protein 426-like isoform X5 n=1 Tax=Arvicola amphibius TaxID=1047088 RepID=UPI0018E36E9F|nr:zinc finger protein 426-like isoform X5 [Arvicola amphibius]